MPKLTLTGASAAAAQCEPGKRKTDYYDDSVTGFVLECRASGGKTLYLRYDNAGRQKQIKLAALGDAPFHQIRKRAEKLRAEVTIGGDPAAEKAVARAVPTYAELAARHMADARMHQRSFSTTEGYMRLHIVPRWGRYRLNDIASQAVERWLADKRAEGLAPATVLKIKMIFQRSFELGSRWGIIGCEKNPVRAVRSKPVNNARERYLTADETVRLREATSASKNKQLASIVDLLLYTGCRLRELLDARWENIDVNRQSWFIPTSKTGKPRHVPLSQSALVIIESLPRFDGCPWLVPNTKTLKPFVSIKHAWQEAREKANLPDLRLHDCRHAAASWMCAAGVDLYAIGKVLGHVSFQSTQRYAHVNNHTLLAAVEAGAAKQCVDS
jgi:integrase